MAFLMPSATRLARAPFITVKPPVALSVDSSTSTMVLSRSSAALSASDSFFLFSFSSRERSSIAFAYCCASSSFSSRSAFLYASFSFASWLSWSSIVSVSCCDAVLYLSAPSAASSAAVFTASSCSVYCRISFSVLAICACWLYRAVRTRSAAALFSPSAATVFSSSCFLSSRTFFCASSVLSSCASFACRPSADAPQSSIPAVAALNSALASFTALPAACISLFNCDMSARNWVVLCVSAIS